MIPLISHRIRRAFSSAAMRYDILTSLHKEIGRDLIKKVRDAGDYSSILDVGMGTGWLTARLAHLFPETKIIGLDFSEGMIEEAKKREEPFLIVQSDAACLPFQQKTFDLIISNLSYQWMEDLPAAFSSTERSLKDGGIFCFTMFGRETFQELFISLEKSRTPNGEKILPLRRLADREQIKNAMEQAGFQNIETDYEIIKTHFPDMRGLVRWIKDIGADHLPRDIYIGKELFNRANEYYAQNFKDRFGVETTFEVVWGMARKSALK